MEIKSNKRGGNLRNRKAKGHVERRKAPKREAAKVRQEAYSKLSLDEKIARQAQFNTSEPYKKQYVKLLALKEKQK